jgi:hypothetical protein
MAKNEIPVIPPFNPLDKSSLGESVADALLQQAVEHLPPEPFIGAGIYAIYYKGDFELYSDISEQNRCGLYRWPIYVGKAVPAGARKGGFGLGANPGTVLSSRLKEHAASIAQAKNINQEDFECRYLVVDDIWIPLAESMLIEMFHPLWNRKIDGFGNHDPGKGRYNQQRSAWDTVHPGRSWAEKLKPFDGAYRINEQTSEYIVGSKPSVLAQYETE